MLSEKLIQENYFNKNVCTKFKRKIIMQRRFNIVIFRSTILHQIIEATYDFFEITEINMKKVNEDVRLKEHK